MTRSVTGAAQRPDEVVAAELGARLGPAGPGLLGLRARPPLRAPCGEAEDFAAGAATALGGRLPVNTYGGQLGEASPRGTNGIAEVVRQVRGTSVNQVPGVRDVLVTAGTRVPTSGLMRSADHERSQP
jgi:hypothetical protein